jgi:hypothetical protein
VSEIRRDLRKFLEDKFCGCGQPEAAAAALLRLLRLHPLHSNREAFEQWISDDGIEMLLLYTLDAWKLTEHGGSVGGAWLTEEGKKIRDALAAEEADEFEALFEQHCIHGFDITDTEHDCMKYESLALPPEP